jgi:uncharacterized protein YkwD
MGTEDRDWYRESPTETSGRGRRGPSGGFVVALAAVAVVGAAVFLGARQQGHTGLAVQLPGGEPVVLVEPSLYAENDPWRSYLADERTCPGGEDASAPLARQLETMRCLIDYARGRLDLGGLPVDPLLSRSATLKGRDIERCEVFAHAPCGGDPSDVARQAGYVGSFGENLYIGDGPLGAPRPALDGWLNSDGHRANLLRPGWRVQSLYVAKLARFRDHRDATLWVSHFGDT